MNPPNRVWSSGDLLAGAGTGLLSFAMYVWTTAPNVTLLDSGEFIVAAQHFGVPHPTGYPLWTLLAWIFQLLPLGNAAWEINIFSGVCGALAVALTTALTRSSLRWLLGGELEQWRGLATTVPISCGLLFAFSFSMWSQATIAEVYTLHALLIGAFLATLYAWLRNPAKFAPLILSFFFLTLAFSNHHLSIVMAPLPFLAVLLVRRDIFPDLLAASLLTALLAYLGFAILSENLLVLKTALRFFYCVMLGFGVMLVVRRGWIEWKLVACLPFAVALGLLPYAYMPFASSTNPPMNWAYVRDAKGFFFSINRTQYSGSLSDQSIRVLGPLMGTSPQAAGENTAAASRPIGEKSLFARLQEWSGFFWLQLGRSFTPIGILGYFGSILVILRLRDLAGRTWIYILEIGFVLAAILQPVADKAETDEAGWWLQMPYHTYTNLIFAILVALGIALGAVALFKRLPRLAWMRFALLALPLAPLALNYDGCSQKDRWFGWQFGYDMLKDLPKGSVVFGGTDPGRFVPTYMILGESTQPPSLKRAPDFDRRDLYIITQNGVGETFYRKYIKDHYGPDRPAPANAFERWLGRADNYPKQPLVFPSEMEIRTAIKKEADAKAKENQNPADPDLTHGVVTRLIWEKNRDLHEFFVEESFPLKWSYDHALPHGLVYKINREPLKEIPEDVVKKDMRFWGDYIADILANPDYAKDYDAQRSFSKLRSTTGHLYLHRKMMKEAETAYRQGLLLWPRNPDSLNALKNILWDKKDFDGYIALLETASKADPSDISLWQARAITEKRKEIEAEILTLKTALKRQPRSRETTEKLLAVYAEVGEADEISALLEKAIPLFHEDPDFLRTAANYSEAGGLPKLQLAAITNLLLVETNNWENNLLLARACFRNNDKKAFYAAARQAIEMGGLPARDVIRTFAPFAPWRDDEEFKALVGKTNP